MNQIGTSPLVLFNPRLAALSFVIEALPNKPMRRNFYSDRSVGSLVFGSESPNFGCDYLIQPACNVPHRILDDSAFWSLLCEGFG
jgi:hypothetical protein